MVIKLNKKRFLIITAVSAITIFLTWLIVDIFLNGKLREFAYEQFLEQFSRGWEELRPLVYLFTFILILIVLFVYFILPNILLNSRLKKEQKKLIDIITDFFDNDNKSVDLDEKYYKLGQVLNNQKLKILKNDLFAKEAEVKKNELIANIAHDLKTPLTSVIGYLMLLNDEDRLPEKVRKKYIKICLRKSQQMDLLTNDFFELTQFSSRNVTLQKTNIDLSQMLLQIADEFYPLLEENKQTVKIECEDGLRIYADGNKLSRVFENIIKNAINYGRAGIEIKLIAKRCDEGVNISISNASEEISQQQLNKFFERSYRGDAARNFETGGNGGLGLSIAKEIIELHGGKISAKYEHGEIIFEMIIPFE